MRSRYRVEISAIARSVDPYRVFHTVMPAMFLEPSYMPFLRFSNHETGDTRMRTAGTLVWLATLVTAWGGATTAAAATERPNLIFVLSDDLAQGDVGCYGQKLIQTPHLDRIAREGTRFTQAYCGTTVCAPSRTSLMTGLHTGHSPVRANWEIAAGEGQLPLPPETVTVAQILHSAGYATGCAGKWGMGMFDTTGSPLKKGFDPTVYLSRACCAAARPRSVTISIGSCTKGRSSRRCGLAIGRGSATALASRSNCTT